MKTIEITEEVYAKLIELANEMTTQNMRGTRMPHMFQIRDWKKVYDAELNGDTKIWLDRGNGIEIETFKDLIDECNLVLTGYTNRQDQATFLTANLTSSALTFPSTSLPSTPPRNVKMPA